MRLPRLTFDLVWKLDNMHTLLDVDRLGGLARMEGNPWRIQVQRFGRATAFVSPAVQTTYYNKVLGLGVAELSLLDELARFVVASGAPTCRIDILPGDLDDVLADRLSGYGLRHADFQVGYYGAAVCEERATTDAQVRALDGPADLDAFLEIFHSGWEMQPNTLGAFVHTMRYWGELPDWHLYLATLDGVPRGCGVLFTRNGIGYLALATTLPGFRNRGCEQALMQHAIDEARRLGCELICGQCDCGSPTARNFERFGMRLAYHKALWILRGPTRGVAGAPPSGEPSIY